MSFDEFIRGSQLAHGVAALITAALFYYQGALGLVIRRGRLKGGLPAKSIKRHRKLGPVLALFVVLIWTGGLTIAVMDAYLDPHSGSGGGSGTHGDGKESIFGHPAHLGNGTVLVALALAAWRFSKRITGRGPSRWRSIHTALGISILVLLILQAILGLGLLL